MLINPSEIPILDLKEKQKIANELSKISIQLERLVEVIQDLHIELYENDPDEDDDLEENTDS